MAQLLSTSFSRAAPRRVLRCATTRVRAAAPPPRPAEATSQRVRGRGARSPRARPVAAPRPFSSRARSPQPLEPPADERAFVVGFSAGVLLLAVACAAGALYKGAAASSDAASQASDDSFYRAFYGLAVLYGFAIFRYRGARRLHAVPLFETEDEALTGAHDLSSTKPFLLQMVDSTYCAPVQLRGLLDG